MEHRATGVGCTVELYNEMGWTTFNRQANETVPDMNELDLSIDESSHPLGLTGASGMSLQLAPSASHMHDL